MAVRINQIVSKPSPKRCPPGFLLGPYGWASELILEMAQAEPLFLDHLLGMSRTRMHTLALVLAHADQPLSVTFIRFLAQARLRDIVDSTLDSRPVGIERALAHLPDTVLDRQSYRRLVDLLSDRQSAKHLHHLAEINDATITLLHEVPPPLRRVALLALEGWLEGLAGFTQGLEFLAARQTGSSFQTLVADLGRLTQPNQLIARIKLMVNALPLPSQLPPSQIGHGRRLDQPAEIVRLAKRWRNCLANYATRINDGGCAIYLWERDAVAAVCLVQRHGRLGWFVDDVKAPRNAELEPEALKAINLAFAEAGVLSSIVIGALENITEAESFLLRHRYHQVAPDPQDPQDLHDDTWAFERDD
jgi:hypothetical protein